MLGIDYLEYDDENEEVTVLESAPDDIHNAVDNDPEYFGAYLNYAITLAACGYDSLEDAPDTDELRDAAGEEYQRMRDAVDDGDIEAAQEAKHRAEMLVEADQRLSESVGVSYEWRDTVPQL